MAEFLVGVVDNVQRIKIIPSMSFWSIFFTNERIIVVKMLSGGEVAANNLRPALFLGGLAGSWIGIGNTMKDVAQKTEAMKSEDVDQILKSDKENFTIPYSDITGIEVTRGGIANATAIKIIARDATYKFAFQPRGTIKMMLTDQDFEKYVAIIKTALPDKITIKK